MSIISRGDDEGQEGRLFVPSYTVKILLSQR